MQQYSPGHGLFCAVQARTCCHAASLPSCMPVWCAPPRCWAATSWAIWQNSGLPSMQERAWSSMHNPEEQVTSQSLLEGAWRKVTHCFGNLQMKSFYTSLNPCRKFGETLELHQHGREHQAVCVIQKNESPVFHWWRTPGEKLCRWIWNLKNKLYFVKPLPEIWVASPASVCRSFVCPESRLAASVLVFLTSPWCWCMWLHTGAVQTSWESQN